MFIQLTLPVEQEADPLDGLDLETLRHMRDRAWAEAAIAWAEYRNHHRNPDDPDSRAVSQLLHDAAWSAEWNWRNLYDTVRERQEQR